jgi:hypothetical protein
MTEHSERREAGLVARRDQPLIGLVTQESGHEVVHYFAEEAAADATLSEAVTRAALDAIGAWSDLNWEEMQLALGRLRHDSPPTPPIDQL